MAARIEMDEDMNGIRIRIPQAPTRRYPHGIRLGEPPGSGAAWRRTFPVSLLLAGVTVLLVVAVLGWALGNELTVRRNLERIETLGAPLRWM